MKALLIGGTGNISLSLTELCLKNNVDTYLINRGYADNSGISGAHELVSDINDIEKVRSLIKDLSFDVVIDFIAYKEEDVRRDYLLFRNKTSQYIFISSASVYRKPLSSPFINEATLAANPYWEYSRRKIACEDFLIGKYRAEGFPMTIVRPSHTYGRGLIPTAVHGRKGFFGVVERIRTGRKVIVPGDGTSLWVLTHSDDFAVGLFGLMDNPAARGEIYQITSDEELTWNQIYEMIGEALGVRTAIVHLPSDLLARLDPENVGNLLGDKANSVIFDNAKIKREVPAFRPRIRFSQGVRSSLAYVYSHPSLQTPDPDFDSWCDRLIEAYDAFRVSLEKKDMSLMLK